MTTKTTAKSRKKTSTSSESPSPTTSDKEVATPPEVTSLEKVRDLLFGEEVQRLNIHQSKIEADFTQAIADLKSETLQRIQKLEDKLIKKLDELSADLKTEEKNRVQDDSGLQDQLNETNESHNSFENKTKNDLADLYDQLMGECNRLQSESDKLSEQLATISQDLTSSKADRSTLAKLLKDMATGLEGEA
jgi:DNA repair exonuclease SbcCD ATPase subunit